MRTTTGKNDTVIIVGAGLGGLATAIRLVAAGRNVTILERADVPGGRAGLWQANGFTFDTGPTVLTMRNLIDELFALLGEDTDSWLTLNRLNPVYRTYFPDGTGLDVHSDPTEMAAEISDVIGPAEAASYEKFVAFLRELYRLEMSEFIDRNFDSPFDVMSSGLAKLVAIGGFRRLSSKVNSYFTDPRTQRIFSFQAMYAGMAPQDALALYAVITYMDSVAGVYFPTGGLHEVPKALAALAAKHGATIRYNADVTSVVRTGSRATGVRLANGEEIAADVVVLNPDLPIAYRDLLGIEPVNVRRLRYSPSAAVLLAGSDANYRQISHHNIHFGRSWRTTFAEIITAGQTMSDPSFFVTNPTYSDPALAPPGKQCYYALFPTPNALADIDWDASGPAYRDEMVATLERHGYRDFGANIEVEKLTTPADWQRMGFAAGAPFAASHTFTQTGPFRPRNIWGDNVVFTGSGTTPGVGVPMVLISGRLAAQRILGNPG